MRVMSRIFGLLVMLSIFSLPVFAQETAQAVPQSGLGLGVLLVALLAIGIVGGMMAGRESNGSEDDLV